MKRPGNTALSRLKKPVAGVGGVTYLHVRFKIPAGISKLYHVIPYLDSLLINYLFYRQSFVIILCDNMIFRITAQFTALVNVWSTQHIVACD